MPEIEIAIPSYEDHIHFTVTFSESFECDDGNVEIPFSLEFKSTKPISKSDSFTVFERNSGIRYVWFIFLKSRGWEAGREQTMQS